MGMQIIVLEDSSKSKFGGGQKISLIVIQILAKHYTIILFDTNTSSFFVNEAKTYANSVHSLKNFGIVWPGYKNFIIKIIELLSFPFLLFINLYKFYGFFRERPNAVLYATTQKNLIFAYVIYKLLGNKFIYHAHLIDRFFLNRFINQTILMEASAVIAVSDVVSSKIKSGPVFTLYNPIIVPKYLSKERLLGEKIIVAVFASLFKIKGIAYFLESYNDLETKKIVEYWIFGSGPELHKLKKYESDKIIFKGFSNNVFKELVRVDILCFPSIIEEAMPMTILEAFSCGIPVIATNIGGQAELVKNDYNGYLVPIKDSKSIAERICHIINVPNVYCRLSKNAYTNLEKFNFNNFEQRLLHFFSKI